MGNKKVIKLLIIFCLIITVTLIVLINIIKEKGFIINEKEETRQYIEEGSVIVRDKYEYNEFKYYNITTEQLLETYLNEYKYQCANDIQAAFNSLDKEYREAKFGTYEVFEQYVKSNITNIIGAKIQTYKINNYDDYKEYILKDKNGNTYIFKVTAVMEYTLFLDDYTVATPSFIEAYKKADSEEKAAINLKKFLEATENNDYKYAYSKLYSTFRTNNFPTQADFENYVAQNWLEYSNIETVNVENQNGIYICTLSITSENNENIERTFMIQLEEETEYLVSFTI